MGNWYKCMFISKLKYIHSSTETVKYVINFFISDEHNIAVVVVVVVLFNYCC